LFSLFDNSFPLSSLQANEACQAEAKEELKRVDVEKQEMRKSLAAAQEETAELRTLLQAHVAEETALRRQVQNFELRTQSSRERQGITLAMLSNMHSLAEEEARQLAQCFEERRKAADELVAKFKQYRDREAAMDGRTESLSPGKFPSRTPPGAVGDLAPAGHFLEGTQAQHGTEVGHGDQQGVTRESPLNLRLAETQPPDFSAERGALRQRESIGGMVRPAVLDDGYGGEEEEEVLVEEEPDDDNGTEDCGTEECEKKQEEGGIDDLVEVEMDGGEGGQGVMEDESNQVIELNDDECDDAMEEKSSSPAEDSAAVLGKGPFGNGNAAPAFEGFSSQQ